MSKLSPQNANSESTIVALSLERVLAEIYNVYIASQQYHWNVEGYLFLSLHTFLEDQYKDNLNALDEVAERIRALDVKVPGSVFQNVELPLDQGESPNNLASAMINDLILRNQKVVDVLIQAIDTANAANDNVTEDLLISRVAVHDKVIWMLKSMVS